MAYRKTDLYKYTKKKEERQAALKVSGYPLHRIYISGTARFRLKG